MGVLITRPAFGLSNCYCLKAYVFCGDLRLFLGQCTYWDYFLDSAHTGIIYWTVHILGLFFGQCTYWDYCLDSAHTGIIFGTVHILGLFLGQCTYWDLINKLSVRLFFHKCCLTFLFNLNVNELLFTVMSHEI